MAVTMFPLSLPVLNVRAPVRDRMRPVVATVVLVSLLATGLGTLPGAEAQSIFIGTAQDTDLGWTFPEGEMPGATVEDASGDAQATARLFNIGDPQSAPFPAPVAQGIDLTSFSVYEADAEVLLMRLVVADLDSVLSRSEGWALGQADIDLDFSLAGHAYGISGSLGNTCDPAEARCEEDAGYFIRMFLTRFADDDRVFIGQVPTRVDRATDTIEILVPRWSLDRSGPGGHPFAGDTITDVQVRTESHGFLFTSCDARDCYSTVAVTDQLPDGDPATDLYTLRQDSVGSRVGIGPVQVGPTEEDEDDDRPPGFGGRGDPLTPRRVTFDVSPGDQARIPLEITNRMDRKTLVEPEYEILSGPQDIQIRGPPHVEVAAGDSIRIEVVVNATATFSSQDPLRLRVGIDALGTTGATADHIEIVVRHVPVLSYEEPRLYFHTRGNGGSLLTDHGVQSFSTRDPFLNAIPDDPTDDGLGVDLRSCCFSTSWETWMMEAAPTHDLPLDVERRVVLHMHLESHEPGTLSLDLSISQGDGLVASSSATVDVVQGEQDVEVPVVLREEADRLHAGAPLEMALSGDFRPGDVPAGDFAIAFVPEHGPFLRTGGASWIEFPILEQAPVSTEVDHLVVDVEGDPASFVNPGRSTLWRLTVLNQADAEETVTLGADGLRAGWRLAFEPGDRFKLGPGESVRFAVRATAPEAAAEGEVLEANISVASALRDGATVGARLSAVVTAGVDVQEETFEADNETVSRLEVSDAEESPAFPPLVGVLALLVVFTARRRRR